MNRTGLKKLAGVPLQPSDIVVCAGIECTIQRIEWQEPYEWRDAYYLEFIDTNGVYRSWKQSFDGGEAYRKNKLSNSFGCDCSDIFAKYGYRV